MSKNDVTDWYKKVGINNDKLKIDQNTYISPESRILCIGPSGSGKTTFLMEYLSRVGAKFYDFYLFTGSTLNEPLYNFLIKKNPEIKYYDNINEFPNLKDIPEDEHEKLVVIDDFINLDKKGMNKIKEWIISSRKKHFTCIFMAQNLSDIPTQIRRNINYFVIFKMNDNFLINYILKTYGFQIPKKVILNMYNYATQKPKNFLLIDTNASDINKKCRHNFLEFLKVKDFE
jgi:energy-coupling factor transporter ATP-binding protein EcfA2